MTTVPSSSDVQPKLGIIAGGGELPLLLADACASDDRAYFMMALQSFAHESDLDGYAHEWTPLGSLGHVMKRLKEEGCEQVVMAGTVTRPDFRSLKMDWRATRLLPSFLSAARKGDNALLSVVLKAFEEDGFTVVGAEDVLANLVVGEGALGAHHPDAAALQDINRAKDVVRELGQLDIGQGAVVCNQLVLALEAVEGTDAMLARCLDITTDLRGTPESRRGVLVKMPKPGQEKRVDLPTIGIQTVERASAAGLAGIAIAAGGALVLNKTEVVAKADDTGLFILGFNVDTD